MRRMRALLLCLVCCAAFAAPDGPYVVGGADGGLEAWSVVDEQRRVAPVADDATITVPAVGALPAFKVKMRPRAAIAPDTVTVPAKSPIFVVADTHGEFEILAQMLKSHKVVDAALKWRFGRGHLVVLGDVFDRGPNHLEILWLLYELEAQAAKAGGGVHLVLGNHETMVMRGDLRYLNAKYVESGRVLGVRSYASLFGPRTVLGQWLRTRPVILRVNDLLCLHGGISRALLDRKLTLADINDTVRATLSGTLAEDGATRERAEFLMTTLGPLWYRGYFAGHADYTGATTDDVAITLQHFGVSRILVGHTIVPTITPLYAGKVIAVQVYPKRDDSGVKYESLLIRGGKFLRALPDGRTEELEVLEVPGEESGD
jgi:hypothetical protein